MTYDNFKHHIKKEYQKIINLLGTKIHDQSSGASDRYKPTKQIRFKTSMLRSDLCDYSDAYIFVKGDILVRRATVRHFIDTRNRIFTFKNNAPFTNYISKINNVFIDNAEDLDIVMSMYNLLEYSKNYRKTTGIFWNYYRDKHNNSPLNDDDPPTINYNADPITDSEFFKYKSSITGKHQIKIKKTVKTSTKEIQGLKKC